MAKKKNTTKSKSFSEAIGLKNIVNEKTNFVTGIILLCFAIYIIIAFISYFKTGEADQSLVLGLRPDDIENSNKAFQNTCGSIGAVIPRL